MFLQKMNFNMKNQFIYGRNIIVLSDFSLIFIHSFSLSLKKQE